MPSETSSVIVLPIRSAPASSNLCTAQAWRSGTGLVRAQSGLPPPVGWPATSNRSFAAKVSADSGPPARPARRNFCPGTNAPISSLPELASSVICALRLQLVAGIDEGVFRPAIGRGGGENRRAVQDPPFAAIRADLRGDRHDDPELMPLDEARDHARDDVVGLDKPRLFASEPVE